MMGATGVATRALIAFASVVACGGGAGGVREAAKPGPSALARHDAHTAASTAPPTSAVPEPDPWTSPPPAVLALDVQAMRGSLLLAVVGGLSTLEAIRVEARLKVEKEVDWIVVAGRSLRSDDAIVLVGLAGSVTDDVMDRVLAAEGTRVTTLGQVRGWSVPALRGRVFFRSRPHTLGIAPRALLEREDALADVAALAPRAGPAVRLTMRDSPSLAAVKGIRELRVSIEVAEGDAGGSFVVDADFDGAREARAAANRFAANVTALRKPDESVARILDSAQLRVEGATLHALFAANAEDFRAIVEYLKGFR
jgi:hypothetical protein